MSNNDFIWRFTPSRTHPQLLEDIFVQRHGLLDDILEKAAESVRTGNRHHVLLVGPRGIGKTHLISLLHHRIVQDESLTPRVRIAWLLEDETVTSFAQLLKRIYELLAEQHPDEFPLEWLRNLLGRPTEQIQRELETQLVAAFADKTLLLLIENLDLIFEGLGATGQKQWRSFLQEYPLACIVASTQRLFAPVQKRTEPFFGFFAPIHLKPLRVQDATELLERIAATRQQQDLVAFLNTPDGRSRVRALHHLAGGNHRIYIVLSGFLTRESLDQLVQPFEKMADELTPYYQERLRWLSPQQRQIVEYLCSQESPVMPKEIAHNLMAAENTISSQLKKLLEYGYVLRNPRGRESLYELAEPLMRLASEVKDKRRKPLRMLVDFLRVWYRPEQLPEMLGTAGSESLKIHLSAAIERSQSSPDPRLKLLQDEIAQAKAEGRIRELIEALEERADVEPSAKNWFDLAYYLHEERHYEESIKSYDEALKIDPLYACAWLNKGISLSDLTRYDASIECYDKALEIAPRYSRAWISKGNSLSNLDRYDASIRCYDMALEIDPQYAIAWNNKGASLNDLSRYEAAMKCFDKSLEIDPQYATAWNNKGASLNNLGRYEEAIECFDKVQEIDPKDPSAWGNKGSSLCNLGRYDAAIECFDKALEIDPKDAGAWNNKGHSLSNIGRYDVAIECYGKALEIDPKDAGAWNEKGVAYHNLDRYDAAIECYDQSLEIDSQSAIPWSAKGLSLACLGLDDAAIECFHTAVTICPQLHNAWNALGKVCIAVGRHDAALKCYENSLKMASLDADAWTGKGASLHCLGRHDAAIECYDKALEIDPQYALAGFNKSEVLFATARWGAGFQQLEDAFRVRPHIEADDASIVHFIHSKSDGPERLRQHVETLIEIYAEAGQLTRLCDGLVRSLKRINADMLSEKALALWRDLWLELGKPHIELELPLRIFRVGIAYLIQHDERVLLDLITTERRILQQALGLEPADSEAQ